MPWKFLTKQTNQPLSPELPIRVRLRQAVLRGFNRWKGWVLVGGLAVVFLYAIYEVPKRQVSGLGDADAIKRMELEDKARATLAQIIAGLSVGAYLTYRNIAATERNINLTEKKHEAERFSLAAQMLSSSNSYERIAAINMLGQIGLASGDYSWLVVEALTAYLREHSPADLKHIMEMGRGQSKPGPEVVTAVGVLCALYDVYSPVPTRLSHGHFRVVNLSRVNLKEARFFTTTMRFAFLEEANLRDALIYDSDFSGAKLQVACLLDAKLRRVSLSHADLSNAQLTGAYFERVDLKSAILDGADLEGADLRLALNLTQAQLDKANGNYSTKLPPGLTMVARNHLA